MKNRRLHEPHAENTYVERAPETDWQAFLEVVKSRRSVKIYTPERIPEAHMRDCINAALLAPSSSNLQPWEFYWVRSKETRTKINSIFMDQPPAVTASELVICIARTKSWQRVRETLLHQYALMDNPPQAVVKYYRETVPLYFGLGPYNMLAPFKRLFLTLKGFKKPTPREPSSVTHMKIWAVKSSALACQTLMLALRARGYDSCPMEGFDSRRLRKLLNLPSDAVPVMGIAAGKRAKNGIYAPRLRAPYSEVVKEI